MNRVNHKKLGVVAILATSAMFSLQANAEQPAIETVITEYVLSQGKQLMVELSSNLSSDISNELTTSISNELNNFTKTENLLWLTQSNSTVISKAINSNKKSKTSAE